MRAFALERADVHEIVSQEFTIRPGMKYIIGVGSIAPTPGLNDNRSAYTIFDTQNGPSSTSASNNDIEASAMKIFQAKIDRNFVNRLFVGV